MLNRITMFRAVAVATLGLVITSGSAMAGDVVIDFSDVAPGTLVVDSPYQSQGFTLTSSSGGFVFNSPDTGNGSTQTVGSNDFYAGANGLAAFSPATITLTQTDGAAFSLLSIDLARNFAYDPAPTVTFTGTLSGGGTVGPQSFTVTEPAGFPQVFTQFDFTGFTNVTSVSWDQPVFTVGLNQFTDITIATVPEPSSAVLGGIAAIGSAVMSLMRRHVRTSRDGHNDTSLPKHRFRRFSLNPLQRPLLGSCSVLRRKR